MSAQMIRDVRQFHRHFGHPIALEPRWLDKAREDFRIMLVDEEYGKELKQALVERNMAKVGDAIADSIYVLIGMALEMGLPLSEIWHAVHEANMRKAVRDYHIPTCDLKVSRTDAPARCSCGAVLYQPSGKTAKPEGWQGPDFWIEHAIEEATKKGTPL